MSYKILVINPGSTSTKIAVYEDEKPLFTKNISHDAQVINSFPSIPDQVDFRGEVIKEALEEEGFDEKELSCAMCRGGLVQKPQITTGGYLVNEDLAYALANEELTSPHASLLGGLLGKQFQDRLGIKAYIYDAVTSVDLGEIEAMTGFTQIKRLGAAHVLNARAMAIKYAGEKGKKYEDMNLIVVHMGGGCSVMAHNKGKITDCLGDDELHISAERAGGAPLLTFLNLCFSGKYTKSEIKALIRGKGGLYAHLGTSDGREIEKRIAEGDEKAKLAMQAMAYSLAKSTGAMIPALSGMPEAIILTGGLAYSKTMTDFLKGYLSAIAPVEILPGENEMDALAHGGIRILKGEEEVKIYRLPEGWKK